jgi:hypothetical protein
MTMTRMTEYRSHMPRCYRKHDFFDGIVDFDSLVRAMLRDLVGGSRATTKIRVISPRLRRQDQNEQLCSFSMDYVHQPHIILR